MKPYTLKGKIQTYASFATINRLILKVGKYQGVQYNKLQK
jgi:hypothetical protein